MAREKLSSMNYFRHFFVVVADPRTLNVTRTLDQF